MSLPAGQRLGPYELLGAIGAGEMGEVYRARDSRLRRDVAIKILPDGFAGDPDRLARFEREARLLASLSHVGIAVIHEVGEEKRESGSGPSIHYLVMELVDGETLARRIAGGPLPLDEALRIARQIAAAQGADALDQPRAPGIPRIGKDEQAVVMQPAKDLGGRRASFGHRASRRMAGKLVHVAEADDRGQAPDIVLAVDA